MPIFIVTIFAPVGLASLTALSQGLLGRTSATDGEGDMVMIRFAAIFVYIVATLLALKSFSDLAIGKAVLEEAWGWNVMLLIACVAAAVAAWILDRRYCKISSKRTMLTKLDFAPPNRQ